LGPYPVTRISCRNDRLSLHIITSSILSLMRMEKRDANPTILDGTLLSFRPSTTRSSAGSREWLQPQTGPFCHLDEPMQLVGNNATIASTPDGTPLPFRRLSFWHGCCPLSGFNPRRDPSAI